MATRALILLSLYRLTTASYGPSLPPSPTVSCATPTTYALVTPSPLAHPTAVTEIGQTITSYIPQYAICNPSHSDCTTVFSTTVYPWCTTTVPCYGGPCSITDYDQRVTFSHANDYVLTSTVCETAGTYVVHNTATVLPEPTTLWYVEPVVTRYVLPYRAYVEGVYDEVEARRCRDVGAGVEVCEVFVERWVLEEKVLERESVWPVTVHTFCGEEMTTGVRVTGRTETRTETRTSTVTGTVGAYGTPVYVRPSYTPSYVSPSYSSPSSSAAPTEAPEYTSTSTVTEDCTSTSTPHHRRAVHSNTTISTFSNGSDHSSTYKYSSSDTTLTYPNKAPTNERRSPHKHEPADHYKPTQSGARKAYNIDPELEAAPVDKRNHLAASYASSAAGAGKADAQKHSYGEYADYKPEYEYRKPAAAGAGYSGKHDEEDLDKRDEFNAYRYGAAGAGKANGQAHSYGEYADHAEEYKYSKSGAGAAYKSEPAFDAELEERDEYTAYRYGAAGAGKANGQKHSYGEYADHSEEYKYSKSGAGAVYTSTQPTYLEERDHVVPYTDKDASRYVYSAAGAGSAKGQKHTYGEYADNAEAYDYRNGGAGAKYNVDSGIGKRDEVAAAASYGYAVAGAGKADGQRHSYGEYADHAEEYKYSKSGAKAAYTSAQPTYLEPEALEGRDEFSAYRYGAAGAGKANGQAHSYGEYADHAEEYKYSKSGAKAAYTSAHPTKYAELEERDHFVAYENKAAGAGKSNGQTHSYGEYADHSEEYKYRKTAAGAGYPKHAGLEERDEFAAGEAGAGKASGEVHSYGQYADYSEEYKYSKAAAGKDGETWDGEDVEVTRGGGAFSGKKSGERHSYGQYQDYEMGVKHEYENAAVKKAGKKGENSWKYGVEEDEEY